MEEVVVWRVVVATMNLTKKVWSRESVTVVASV
jgi:hypothetical protein